MKSIKKTWHNDELVKVLSQGGVVVMPTDTVYGVVGKASDPLVVERIYKIKKRDSNKPLIILISDAKELENFSITLSREQKKSLKLFWPGSVSIVFDCEDDTLSYLHRGTKTLAVRLPEAEGLRKLIKKTGPLVAPLANPEGLPPATTIPEARRYFDDLVDLYLDGAVKGKPSKIIKLHFNGSVSVL